MDPMRWFFILITAAILHACSSKQVIPAADRSITPLKAASSQPSDSSNLLQWGGVIIETRNLRETTEIQILAYPLDEDGHPDTDANTIGRFIAQQPGYLETVEYAVGRLVTATGKLSEVRQGQVADSPYPFPILDCDEITLWPERKSRPKPRIRFGFGASSGGGGFGSIGISF
ncbi:MAG: Slp family lipoprotein [Candidatus Thiodiazotropha endolucinida]|nr:Slp family lipoprotein [Candidatus Thiodiazotropha endolucinida]